MTHTNSRDVSIEQHGAIATFHWLKDKTGKFLTVSENIAEMAGLDSAVSLIGKSDDHMPWQDRVDLYNEEEKIALSGKLHQHYQLQTTIKGTIKIIVTKSPLLNQFGKIIGTIGSSIDVTNKYIAHCGGKVDSRKRLHLGKYFNNEYLTRKEFMVLKYTLHGYTSKKTGELLNLSKRTVESYIINIKAKLQCQTKGDIIHVAIKHGLLNTSHK